MEGAAGWRIDRIGNLPFHLLALAPCHFQVGHRVQKHARVGMAWLSEQRLGFRHFGQTAQIEYSDPVRHVADDGEVVADEKIGQPELGLQILHQVEDLRLHRDVESRGRLVADDEVRLRCERPRDGDALALAAGELMRKLHAVFGRKADQFKQVADALSARIPRH
jgi:hypothetical protein